MGDNRLASTVLIMLSEDWKDRLKAEYRQLSIRMESVENVVSQFDDYEELTAQDKELLIEQYEVMCRYMNLLEDRAELHDINLFE